MFGTEAMWTVHSAWDLEIQIETMQHIGYWTKEEGKEPASSILSMSGKGLQGSVMFGMAPASLHTGACAGEGGAVRADLDPVPGHKQRPDIAASLGPGSRAWSCREGVWGQGLTILKLCTFIDLKSLTSVSQAMTQQRVEYELTRYMKLQQKCKSMN